MNEFKAAGLSIPGDISIIGFDDMPLDRIVADFARLYPSIAISWNMSLETVREMREEPALNAFEAREAMVQDYVRFALAKGVPERRVVATLRDIARGAGLDWDTVGAAMKREGRLHLETY